MLLLDTSFDQPAIFQRLPGLQFQDVTLPNLHSKFQKPLADIELSKDFWECQIYINCLIDLVLII